MAKVYLHPAAVANGQSEAVQKETGRQAVIKGGVIQLMTIEEWMPEFDEALRRAWERENGGS